LTSLVPVLVDVVVPAAKSLASVIDGLVTAFTSLPQPIQTMITATLGIAAALGPVLIVLGKVIGLVGGAIKVFVALKVAALALSPALVPIVVAFGPILAIVALVAVGIYLLVKAVQAIVEHFGGWEVVMAAFSEFFSDIWESMKQMAAQAVAFLGQKLNEIAQFFAALPGKVLAFVSNMVQQVVQFFQNMGAMALNAVKNMVSQVVNYVKNMAANVISSIKSMFMAVVGNSIIPDMVRGVIGEFGNMTDQSIKDTERLVKGVNGTLAGINSRVAPGVDVSGGTAGRASTAGGNTTVDMRHAIIRDDKDMLDRMRRRGLEMSGAF